MYVVILTQAFAELCDFKSAAALEFKLALSQVSMASAASSQRFEWILGELAKGRSAIITLSA
eukprot:669838-Karenia_brevis.AAC.1